MHAIDTSGSVAGAFSNGNPATGQLATFLGADWLNDVQANVLAVLDDAGIEPVKGRPADLLDAIKAIAEGVTGSEDDGGVPTTRLISAGGLASGGGDMTANRTITVTKATGAESAAGTRDDVAATPKAMKDGFAANGGAEVFTFPGGRIMQTCGVSGSFGSGSHLINFPFEFPTSCSRALVSGRDSSGGERAWVNVVNWSKSSVTVIVSTKYGEGGDHLSGFDIIAVGY